RPAHARRNDTRFPLAQEIELRARIARLLQSAGYAVELAECEKRALELAAGGQIEAAIRFQGRLSSGIERTKSRQDHSLQGANALSVQALDEQKLLDELGRPTASPGSADGETAPASILKIQRGVRPSDVLRNSGRTRLDDP